MAQYVSAAELAQWIAGKTPPLVGDVRIGQLGQIPGAVHVPVLDLEDEPRQWDPRQDIVVFCQFGKGASEYAAEVLEEQGFERVFKLSGGMDAWNAYLAGLESDK